MSQRKKELLRTRLNQIGELEDPSHSEAIVLLIVEHSRIEEGTAPDLKKSTLPYGVKVKKTRISLDLEELPEKLQWILWKFTKLEISKSQRTKSER